MACIFLDLVTVAGVDPDGVGPMPRPTTTIVYDGLGQKASLIDPDMGMWLYRWDLAGNLRKQRDARNVLTCFYYDNLNRLVGKSFHPNTPDPASVNCSTQPTPYPVAYSYDAGPNGKGRRSNATVYNSAGSVSNSVSWTYDSRGRVTKETVSVTPPGFTSALSYETDYSYDAADRLRTMTYPADVGGREIVTTAYNTQGLPYSLTSSNGATYVSSTTYDALGRLDQQMLGNALMTDRDYWEWSDVENGGRLKRIFLLKAPYNSGNQSDKLQDLMYRYDAAGNVTNIQDTINRSGNEFQRECFSYDALNRLTRGFSTGAATCNNNPGAVGSGVYDQSYAFTANGNLASKTGVGSYTYSASSPSGCATDTQATKPHAVNTAGGATYTYDCNGNMTGRTATGSTVTLAYDAENRLASVTDPVQPPGRQTTFYQYNADGQRVVKTDTVNGTLFVGNHMEANWTTGPLAWPLGDFEAIDQGDNILVSWVTLFETELLGFNLHRSTDPDRPEQQLNPAVIPVQNPGSTTGAFYTWLDEEVEQGKPYYYWLELLMPSGSEWVGPIGVGEGRLPTSQSPQVTAPNSYRRYYYLGGQRIAMRFVYATGSVLNYLHADHLGSARLTTNQSGQVLQGEPSAYYPYGELRYGFPAGFRRFTGQYFDDEMDLYYYGARYYDGALARFIQPDTIVPQPGNPQALNRYSYVTNRPTIAIDPTGHDLMIVGGAGGDLDIAIWQQWIMEYKGWSLEQWNKFHATWYAAQDMNAKNVVLAAEGIGVFNWGGATWDEAKANAQSDTTISMIDELASQMAGMKDVTLVGWSKGGNLVLQYLWAQQQGRLKDAVIPVRAVLLAPGTHPLGPILGASWVRNEVPGGWPATVNICSHGDRACPLTIRNAVWNINPPWNGNFHGPHGRFAASVIDALNVAGHHQARPRLPG